ncbi:VanW family protein [Paenibacillus harenae]|uniref:Vancomycin resistance protein YoaR n=1 Tax=Paenibacillus harenae TaxID=306543 RepID=A0ABT9UDS7_PAEHA|nr:VanW family protein [Paenibacillus harenae]MDQ0116579.1 vancomycin resistance protein YoaR [Paenibacillus harenae]
MKRLYLGLAITFVILIAAAGVGWGFVWNYATQDTVPEEVVVGGIPIGGMPIDEAIGLLDDYERSLLNRAITIKANTAAGDSKQWSVGELGYKAEFKGVKEALHKLREGRVWDRAEYRYRFPKSYSLSQSWERDTFDAAVRKQWGWVENNEPKDATRTITDEDEVRYVPHVDGYRIQLEPLSAKVDEWVWIGEQELGKPVERTFTDELPVTAIHPKITLAALKEEGIERKIVEFATDFKTSAEGRAHNVTITAEMLNDTHLAPGDVFDYDKLITATEKVHTYREAPVILNGKLVPGIGGGICQVSSTLYNAVLRAGLEIVERRNHSIPVAYLPLGQDATYSGGSINFRFKNTTGKHLIIRTEVKDRKLTIKLFGTMDESLRYGVESVTLNTLSPKIVETVNASLPTGKQVVVDNGKQGYVVDTFRILYKDGKEASRERISHDTYRAQPTIIERGPQQGESSPAPTPTPNDSVVEDGV